MSPKSKFEQALHELSATLTKHISTEDGQWTVKGFIDTFKNVYTISSDPDISLGIPKKDESVKFAVDFKTTYRNPKKPWLCNLS